MNLLKDAKGDTSSKRVIAFSGFAVMGFVTIYSIITKSATLSNVLWPWAVMVGALLGVTVLEKK